MSAPGPAVGARTRACRGQRLPGGARGTQRSGRAADGRLRGGPAPRPDRPGAHGAVDQVVLRRRRPYARPAPRPVPQGRLWPSRRSRSAAAAHSRSAGTPRRGQLPADPAIGARTRACRGHQLPGAWSAGRSRGTQPISGRSPRGQAVGPGGADQVVLRTAVARRGRHHDLIARGVRAISDQVVLRGRRRCARPAPRPDRARSAVGDRHRSDARGAHSRSAGTPRREQPPADPAIGARTRACRGHQSPGACRPHGQDRWTTANQGAGPATTGRGPRRRRSGRAAQGRLRGGPAPRPDPPASGPSAGDQVVLRWALRTRGRHHDLIRRDQQAPRGSPPHTAAAPRETHGDPAISARTRACRGHRSPGRHGRARRQRQLCAAAPTASAAAGRRAAAPS